MLDLGKMTFVTDTLAYYEYVLFTPVKSFASRAER